MNKIKTLNKYQKAILLFMIAMIVFFAAIYSVISNRVGFSYMDEIFIPSQENGYILYTGKIQGEQATFKVSPDKTVIFQHGDNTYPPYTFKEDATAIPNDMDMSLYDEMKGIEVRQEDEILFRGVVTDTGSYRVFLNEDGSLGDFGVTMVVDGIAYGDRGNIFDPIEPTIHTILELISEPQLTHKGEWGAWFYSVFICFITALSILFVDELFYFCLQFDIRNAQEAEPSDWEIASRYIAWTLLPIGAFICLIMGLQ